MLRNAAVQHQFHIARPLEFLENQVIHAAVGFHQGGGNDSQGTGLARIAGGGKKAAGHFQSAGVNAAGHRAAASLVSVIVGAGQASNGIHQQENMLPRLYKPFGAFNAKFRHAAMIAHPSIIGRGVYFSSGEGTFKLRHFFRTLVYQKHHQVNGIPVILQNGFRHVLKQRRLPCAGRRDNQAALAAPDWSNQIQCAGGVTLRPGFKRNALIRIDRLELFKVRVLARFLRSNPVNGGNFRQKNAAVMTAGLPMHPHGRTQTELADHILRHINGFRKSVKIIIRLP